MGKTEEIRFGGIKGRLILSFSLFIVVLIVIFLIFFWLQRQEEYIRVVEDRIKGVKLKVEKANNLQKDFFIIESVNANFYETRESRIVTEQKILLQEIREILADLKESSFFKEKRLATLLNDIIQQSIHFEMVFDSLVAITLERGYKSYGYEGEMRRALGSVYNSGYELDAQREMMLRRYEKDYFIHRDERYVSLVFSALDTLKIASQSKINDFYGKVFVENALQRYKTAFTKLVEADQAIGFHGEPGLRESLVKLSAEIENHLQYLEEELVEIFEKKATNLRYVLLVLFAVFILMNVVLGTFLFRSISSPIRKLSLSIHQVVESNFEHKNLFVPKRKDEIALLAKDFRYMLDKVEERTEQVVEQKEKISRAYENIKLLRQIGQEITTYLSVQKILDTFFTRIQQLINLQVVYIGIYDRETKGLKVQGYRKGNKQVSFIRSLEENNRIGIWCYNEQKSLITNDFQWELETNFAGFRPLIEDELISSAIYLPLTSKENRIGVLTVQSTQRNAFNEWQIDLVQSLSVYLVSALENALMYENLEEVVQERTQEILEQKNEIESQKAALEYAFAELAHKNNQLTSSINYARRIQQAILPDVNLISSHFQESFIFFQPRDIVSGDLYWYKEIKHLKQHIIAAIDCTGHGVPGAFMSMIANEVLFNIVSLKGINMPHEILKEMHKSIRAALKQDETDSKDGMDVALCNIDTKKGEVYFAGAKNPLIYIQHTVTHPIPQFHVLAGDKHPVGGQLLKEKKGEDRLFTLHTIPYRHPDLISTNLYLFSDGFQDQFGGEENPPKKFMATRFRNLLLAMAHKPMSEQYQQLQETFSSWKKQHKQTDDVLVMGVRLIN